MKVTTAESNPDMGVFKATAFGFSPYVLASDADMAIMTRSVGSDRETCCCFALLVCFRWEEEGESWRLGLGIGELIEV